MAILDFGLNDNSTVKLWSKVVSREAFAQTYVSRFMGGQNSILWEKEDLSKNAGDRVRCSLRLLMDADGVTEDEVLEGSEESLRFATDDVLINELAHAARWHGTIATQRVQYDVRDEAQSGLSTWFAEKFDTAFFAQIGGDTDATTKKAGNNAGIAATSDTGNTRMIIGPPSSGADAEASLSSTASQGFQLPAINEAVRIAKTARPLIKPVRVDAADRYALFISPGQNFMLQTDIEATTTRIKWQDIQLAAMQGGQISNNPIFNGSIGMYANTVLHEATRLPLSPGTTIARRAVFCGQGAAAVAFGRQTPGLSRLDWHEEDFDHGRQHSIKAGSIYGMKKMQYNNRAGNTVDYGTIIIATIDIA